MVKTGHPRASISGVTISANSAASGTSVLLRMTTRGRLSRSPSPESPESAGVYAASSASRASMSEIGSRPGSRVAQSITCANTAQRSMWRRKSRPKPRPSLAPGISPGTSATVKVVSPLEDDAEVGDQSCEGVVGDLRLGRRENGHKRGLTGGGESEQTDVGYRLEFENQVTLDTVLTEECETGALRAFEASAALPSPPRPP